MAGRGGLSPLRNDPPRGDLLGLARAVVFPAVSFFVGGSFRDASDEGASFVDRFGVIFFQKIWHRHWCVLF